MHDRGLSKPGLEFLSHHTQTPRTQLPSAAPIPMHVIMHGEIMKIRLNASEMKLWGKRFSRREHPEKR